MLKKLNYLEVKLSMKRLILWLGLACLLIGIFGLIFTPKKVEALTTATDDFIVHGEFIIMNANLVSGLDVVELTTIREKDNNRREDNWQGVRLADFLQKNNIVDAQVMQFISSDKYQVMLSQSEIDEFDPIIATARNGQPSPDTEYRLVSQGMPEMFWISHIRYVIPIKSVETYEFQYEKPISEVTGMLSLLTNPGPFTGVQGYSVSDFVKLFIADFKGSVKFTSRDGIFQTLSMENYLKNAYLIVDKGNFNLQSPDMPTGMWQKNISMIEINGIFINFDK